MPEFLKRAAPAPEAATQSVRDTVSEILLAVQREGEPAVRRYSQALDGWSPPSFRVDTVPEISAQLRDHIDDSLTQVRGFAAAQRATLQDLEVETLPGDHARPPPRAGQRRRLLLAGRQVPADRLLDHDRGRAQGGGRFAGRRLRAATGRRGHPPAAALRDARLGGRRGLLLRRRPGAGRDGVRDRRPGAGRHDRRPRQRVRRRGQAPALRAGRHRSDRRPVGDPRPGRRERRPGPRGRRPARAGRARADVPGDPRHGLARLRRRGPRRGRALAARPGRRPTWRAPPGARAARSWCARTTRRWRG